MKQFNRSQYEVQYVHCRDSVTYPGDDDGDVEDENNKDHSTEPEEYVLINDAELFQPHFIAGAIQPS